MRNRQFPLPFLFALLGALLAVLVPAASGQIYDPVQWRLEFEGDRVQPGSTTLARLTATIDDTWHIYSTTTPAGIKLELALAASDAIEAWRAYQPEPEIVYDPNFQEEVEWYSNEAVFLFEIDLAEEFSGEAEVEARVRYGACDPRQCLPPKRKAASATLTLDADAPRTAALVPGSYRQVTTSDSALAQALAQAAGSPAAAQGSGAGVAGGTASDPEQFQSSEQGLLGFSLLALGFGFLAILTPCVFPMIPIYMGSFLSGGERPWRSVLGQAGTFCLGVIVLFTAIGGALSAFLGPFGLSQIGSNLWVNLMIAAVMFAFAASMLGAFELTVPSSWTSGASARSTGTGLVPTLMLSLVFTLASFACTGPFMGSLLAGSVASGGAVFPAYGMGMFAVGLSAPFFVLALFPALMNRLPRSGGWLAVSKRTAGLVILAVGLKYLGIADKLLGWDFLTRERFLAIWFVLFAAAALYLWGILRMADDAPAQGVGLVRLGTGAAFLALAVSLLPGMFGARLGELDAHVPEGDGSGLASSAQAGLSWIKDDYDGARAQAAAEGKTLLVSFTGYSCSNCKWMKANMFTKPEVSDLLRDTVLVELYTDGYDEASERHQELQVNEFRSSSIPFYALISPDGSVAATFSGQTRDVEEFRSFLKSAS